MSWWIEGSGSVVSITYGKVDRSWYISPSIPGDEVCVSEMHPTEVFEAVVFKGGNAEVSHKRGGEVVASQSLLEGRIQGSLNFAEVSRVMDISNVLSGMDMDTGGPQSEKDKGRACSFP